MTGGSYAENQLTQQVGLTRYFWSPWLTQSPKVDRDISSGELGGDEEQAQESPCDRAPGISVTFQVERSDEQMFLVRRVPAVSSHSGFC